MIREDIRVNQNIWLSSKSVAEFVQKASTYKSSIWIEKDDKKANAKSMLGIMALGVTGISFVTVIAEGEDEDAAIRELEEFICSNA